jgi:hypothetical protein
LDVAGAQRAKGAQDISQRNALGLKDPQHARPEWARGILPPSQGETLFDWSFPARCAWLIPFAAFSAEDKLGHYCALQSLQIGALIIQRS